VQPKSNESPNLRSRDELELNAPDKSLFALNLLLASKFLQTETEPAKSSASKMKTQSKPNLEGAGFCRLDRLKRKIKRRILESEKSYDQTDE
ncbi:MAG: hypothetical protein AAF939_22960, partial [Planctomycetota bacterium]